MVLREKIDLIASYAVLVLIMLVLSYLYPRNTNSWLFIVLISFAATIVFYRILGGISEGSSLTLNGMKIGGSLAIFSIVLYLLSNLSKEQIKLTGVKATPTEDNWIAINRENGKRINEIILKQDTLICGSIKPSNQELNLNLKLNSNNQIFTDSNVLLGKVTNNDFQKEKTKCDYTRTKFIKPYEHFDFEAENNIYDLSLKFGFCINIPGKLFFRIKNSSGLEATYEKTDGQLIQLGETKTFNLKDQRYFINCTDYDPRFGASKFIMGIIE